MKKRYIALLFIGAFFISTSKAQVTYNEVADIFYSACTGCHHTDGSAPMPLMNYLDCSSNATDIEIDLNSGKMPPWLPDTTHGNVRFMHEQIISQADKNLILQWITDGALEGDTTLAPDAPYYDDYAYKLCPEPTMILQIPSYTLEHDEGHDCFVLPTNLPTARYLRAYEVVPGNASIVQDVFAGVGFGLADDTTGNCLLPIVTQYIGGHSPNAAPTVWPDKPPLRCGMLIPANAEINLKIHYGAGCLGQSDSTQIRLYFYSDTATNVRNITTTTDINNYLIFSLPNTVSTIGDTVAIDSNRSLLAIYPYAHGVTTDVEVNGVNDTPEIPLLKINNWDRKWSNFYQYQKPVKFPATYSFGALNTLDNTSNNPNNPNNPPEMILYDATDTGEVQYVATQWLRYQEGDEFINIDSLLQCDTLLVCRPGAAGTILGSSTICSGQSGVEFSVPAVANAETYTWSYSGTGATITGTGKSVTIDFTVSATSGNLTVMGVNECGVSGAVSPGKTLTLSNGNPVEAADTISGTDVVCNDQTGVAFTTPIISGATEYTWSYSGIGVTINGTSESVTIDFSDSATSGDLTVMGINDCIDGTVSAAYSITVYAIPAIPTIVKLDNCGSVQLTSSASTGTYLWSPSGETTQSITVTTDDTYSVTVTSGGTCSAISAGEVVSIMPLPTVLVQDGTRCGDGVVELGAAASSGLPTWYAVQTGGTALATATSYTTTSLTATTTYYVDATENGCTSDRLPVIATINNGPTANISGDVAVCAGDNGTLTIDLTGTAPWDFTYGSSVGSNPVTGITTATYTVAASAETYTLSAISDASGCPSLAGGSGSATITENTDISVSNITKTCNGGGTGYTVEFDIAGGDVVSYAVTGDVGSLTTTTHFTSSEIISGTQSTFNVTDAADCNPVQVSEQKTCDCAAEATLSGGGTICTGSEATISIDLVGTSPWSIIYAIDGTDEPEVTGITASPYTFTTTVAGDYTLSSVGDLNCTGSTSGTATVSETSPTATISGGGAICIGDSVNVIFDLTVGSPPWSFTYTDGITTSASITSNFINKSISVSTAGTYSIVSMSAGSCNGAGTGSVDVTVNQLPTVGATASPSATICAGSELTLNGTGADTYVWTGGVTDSVAISITSDMTYTVTGTDVNGCVNTAEQSITVKEAPAITQTSVPSSAAVCAGETVTLTASGAGVTIFTWTGGITNGVPFVPTELATYTVSGTDASGCTGTAIRTVNALALPEVGIVVDPDVTICLGDDVTLTATGADTYTWLSGIVNGQAFAPATTETYTVTGKGDFSCTNTATQTITVDACGTPGVGIEESNTSIQKVSIFPNPSSGTFKIVITNAHFRTLTLSIINLLGNEVFNAVDSNISSDDYSMDVSLESIPDGVYYLKINTDTEMIIEKIILQ